MKKTTVLIFMLLLLIAVTASCSGNNESSHSGTVGSPANPSGQESDKDSMSGDGTINAEEEDGAVITRQSAEPSKFYGSWTGTSEKAVQLYGNVDIVVNSDGTWTGNITGEQLSGKWKKKGGGLHMSSDIFSFDLVFNDADKLVMVESGGEEELYTVLTKK